MEDRAVEQTAPPSLSALDHLGQDRNFPLGWLRSAVPRPWSVLELPSAPIPYRATAPLVFPSPSALMPDGKVDSSFLRSNRA
jgi:hypothetical protein